MGDSAPDIGASVDRSGASAERSFRQSLYAMLGLSSVVMMVAIDQTVVGTALPTIVAELKGFEFYAWVATAYLLTSVITVPIFGRLGDWFGRKPLIVLAIVVFTGASVLCGAAGNMRWLVVFRALQGVGGGMLVGTCFASIPDLFPDPVIRLRWQVLFSSAFGVANALGPSLGGFLSQHFGWRSAFLVNLPVGIVSLYLTAMHLPDTRHRQQGELSPDWWGALLIALALGMSQLLVESLPDQGVSLRTFGYAAIAVAAAVLLARVESRASHPILPPALLRNRAVMALLALSMLMGVALFALLFYVPLLLQGGMGFDADKAGAMITPFVVCVTVGTLLNTRFVTRLKKPNMLLYLGFALLTLACAGIAAVGAASSTALLVVALLAGGVGIGLVMPNLTVFAQQVAGKLQLGIATAMIQSARMIGGMLGTAVVGTIVRALYRRDIVAAMEAHGVHTSTAWAAPVWNPLLLLNTREAARFVASADHAGISGDTLVSAARAVLMHSIHGALCVVMILMIVACVAVRCVPLIRIAPLGAGAAHAPGPE